MTTFNYATLDPRPIPAAVEANDNVFANPVYGIEVTVPALAAKCAVNIDPQHAGANADLAAIEVAITAELPVDGMTLATVRADLDAVGTMAILALRASGRIPEFLFRDGAISRKDGGGMLVWSDFLDRVYLVAVADKFARGGYPGPKALPTRANPWDESAASAESSRPLAAINAAVADFKVALADRVSTMTKWLLLGEEPQQYRVQVEKERMDMVTALENGQIKYATCTNGRIAVVESTHRAATMVGYALAPVVVALNPSFKTGPGDPYKKFTICAFEPKFADIKSALAELATLENGWGGSPTIGGSPQGVSSTLSVDQVVEVVEKYLK